MLQFALQDLKIALANTPSVHPLFVLYCIVYYKRERVCVCVSRWLHLSPGPVQSNKGVWCGGAVVHRVACLMVVGM